MSGWSLSFSTHPLMTFFVIKLVGKWSSGLSQAMLEEGHVSGELLEGLHK